MAALNARLAVRITPDDVGRRVTVRSRYHGAEAAVVDAVGILASWHDGILRITRRDGSTTTVPEADLVAAKVVPDRPPGRRRAAGDG